MQSNIECPHCQCRLKVKESLIGKELPCPRCGKPFDVPDFRMRDENVAELFAEEPPPPKPKSTRKEPSLALPPRRKSKAAKEAEKRKRARKNAAAEQHAETTDQKHPLAILEKLPFRPAALAGGLAVMVCGILAGLLVWNFLQPAPTGLHEDIAANESTDSDGSADTNTSATGEEEEAYDAGDQHDADRHSADGHAAYVAEMRADREADSKAEEKNSSPKSPAKEIAEAKPQPEKKVRSKAETIAFLKAATVFVKVKTSEGEQTGSGFLLEGANGRGLVVTNAHVIDPEEGKLTQIDCVFHSGSQEEFSVKSTVVGKDDGADLAVLSVSDKRLPEALDPVQEVELIETLPVLILGFPFGEILTTSKRNPAITISKGTISSIRKDDFDQLTFLQIDGGINPGNSGGPVVTEDGNLVGISVAKLRGTEIGLAIPQQTLASTIRGRVSQVEMTVAEQRTENSYTASVHVVDPRKNIESAYLLTCPASRAKNARPEKNGQWKKVDRGMTSIRLDFKGTSKASVSFRVPRRSGGSVFQIMWKLKDGTELLTAPVNCDEVDSSTLAFNGVGPGGIFNGPDEKGGAKIVALPEVMSDFAMNPINGDIVTLDPRQHRAYLLRKDDVSTKVEIDEVPVVRTGDTPIGVTFKQFQGKNYFAVVCTQDPHMYLIDADDFKLSHKVPLADLGVSSVTCSTNPADPFLYYSYGAGRDSAVGAVDIRKMQDRGVVMTGAMDCAISADGKKAYRRGPFSPSGFESLRLTGSLDGEKPAFSRHVYDHRSTAGYVPGPFGDLTATGNQIYSANLDKLVATLKFVPLCFFRSRPVIIGLDGPNLRAASYNTRASVGVGIRLPGFVGGIAEKLPRGVGNQADFKRVGLNLRLLADDANERVVFAFRNVILSVPLKAFRIPDEPYMTLDVNMTELTVGEPASIEIRARDPRVKVNVENLPPGAVNTDSGLDWTPTDDSLGKVTLPVSLSYEDVKTVTNLEFRVTQAFVTAPFEVGGMAVSEDGSQLTCWTAWMDQYGRPATKGKNGGEPEHYIGVVSLDNNGETAKKKLPFAIREAVVFGKHVAVVPVQETTRVEVYDTSRMARVKTLLSDEPLTRISATEEQLLLHGNRNVDVYSIKTFKRIRSLGGSAHARNIAVHHNNNGLGNFKDGVMVNGVLFDRSGKKPQLIVSPGGVPILASADSKLYSGIFLRRYPQQQNARLRAVNGGTTVGPMEIPGRGLNVTLNQVISSVRAPGNAGAIQQRRKLSLSITDRTGGILSRVSLVDETGVVENRDRYMPVQRPQMKVVGDTVLVSDRSRIFKWSSKQIKNPDNDDEEEDVDFHVVPVQSEFSLRASKTELRHTVKGGEGPFEYFLFTRLNGVTMNEQTGVVTIDQNELVDEAIPVLRRYASGAKDLADTAQRLQAATINMIDGAMRLLGRKPKGIPVAVPIHFKVIDDGGTVAEMQYFVVLEVPYRSAAGKIWALAN